MYYKHILSLNYLSILSTHPPYFSYISLIAPMRVVYKTAWGWGYHIKSPEPLFSRSLKTHMTHDRVLFLQRVAFNGGDATDGDALQTNVITAMVADRETQELQEHLDASSRSLAHRMSRLEKRIKGVMYRESLTVERENRLSRLEADLNATKEALAFNATRQDATQDRLHGSLLELLESVENLDDRVDSYMPEVRKEISKIEFAVARINASVAIIKEDQASTFYLLFITRRRTKYYAKVMGVI